MEVDNLRLLRISLAIFLAFAGCSKHESYQGVVGNYYAITVQAPYGVDNPTFDWAVLEIPEESELLSSDLVIGQDGHEMTFQPDAPGRYTFRVTVFGDLGKQVAAKSYPFDIESAQQEKVEERHEEIAVQPKYEQYDTAVVEDTAGAKAMVTAQEESAIVETPVEDTVDKIARIVTADLAVQEELTEEEAMPIPTGEEEASVIETAPAPAPKKPAPGSQIPVVEGKLTIQISSWPTLPDAQLVADKLTALGFDTYVQRAYFPETDEVWFRVRVGDFANLGTAKSAAKEIEKATDYRTWIDHVRTDL